VAESGGQPGNKNSTKEKRLFADAVRRLAIQQNGKELREVIESLFASAKAGEVPAIKEIADRLDGRVPQAIVGPDNGPIQVLEVPWVRDRSR